MNQLAIKPSRAFAMLGISENTGYKLIKDGTLEAIKFGNRWLIPLSSIEKFIKAS